MFLAAAALPAQARVVRFDVASRTPIAYGYEKIVGKLTFADSPVSQANRRVVDIALAPRNGRGEVESAADIVILAPAGGSRASCAAVIDIPNRGGATALALNRGRFARDAATPDDLGDGFLMRHGFCLVVVGWQFDVPREPGLLRLTAPVATDGGRTITGLVRSDFHVDAPAAEQGVSDRDHVPYPVASENDPANVLTERDEILAPRRTVARASWRFTHGGASVALDGNFVPGKIYELVYRAKDPVVAGLGLAAVRDTVSFLKHDPSAPLHVTRAYGFGISQSGRFLRMLVQRGFDSDEAGRPVFDAIVPVVSGPAQGSFDHRFAQPSRDGAAFSSFFYPTDVPPFHEAQWLPKSLKVIDVDTSHEYWGRTASLMTTTEDGARDVVLPQSVRFYAIAGGMHVPNVPATLRDGMRQRTDPLDYRWVERALLLRLDAWVRAGAPPPASRYPTIAGGTLVAPEAWTFPAIPGMTAPAAPVALHRTWRYDFGPRWKDGIDDREPPGVGAPYATLVPRVDADGIDLGGLRLPEIAVPLATYTGWNLRTPATGFGDHLVDFFGSFAPFAATRAQRLAANDPRLSVEERYADRDAYLRAYDAATAALVRDGYVLQEDAPALHARAVELWTSR